MALKWQLVYISFYFWRNMLITLTTPLLLKIRDFSVCIEVMCSVSPTEYPKGEAKLWGKVFELYMLFSKNSGKGLCFPIIWRNFSYVSFSLASSNLVRALLPFLPELACLSSSCMFISKFYLKGMTFLDFVLAHRFREERLQRIARYKSRLALLLPPVMEQCVNDTSTGTWSVPT